MKPRVLVVEDNPTNVYLATFLLQRHGFEVEHARDGLEALARARAAAPAVILMDLQMPRMSGYEATEALLADPRTAAIPVIAVTAYAMAGDREKALAMGFRDYIEKPYDPATFASLVAAHVPPPP